MTDDYQITPQEEYPAWLKIDANPIWPYKTKVGKKKSKRIKYSKKLINAIAHYRSQGISFGKIADILGENRERVRYICENKLEEK